MNQDDKISLSSGNCENSSSTSDSDVIVIDVDSSSESNSNVFKLSKESNDSNSNYKTLERLLPPVTRRKSWLNRKSLKPHDNVIIDDDTQLPGIDHLTSINNDVPGTAAFK